MSAQASFVRLKPDLVRGILEPSARVLRDNYLKILTLLYDALARYGSDGNATVFASFQEVDHLVYEALNEIRSLVPRTDVSVPSLSKTPINVHLGYVPTNRQGGTSYQLNIGKHKYTVPAYRLMISVDEKRGLLSIEKNVYSVRDFGLSDFMSVTGARVADLGAVTTAYDSLMIKLGAKLDVLGDGNKINQGPGSASNVD